MAWIPVIGVLLVGLAGPPPPAPAIAQTCRGMPATIVGTPHQEVNGTAAADVIVTNGARFVYTRGGDDVVCTTSTPLDPRAVASVQVETGSGDDVVDTTGDTSAPSVTYLEGGDDRFYGGDQRDTVIDFDGKGADRVHLGAGSDLFYARSEPSPGTLDGGPGADILVADPGRDGPWVFDNRAHRATRAGEPVFSWSSFEIFDLAQGFGVEYRGTNRFLGGPDDEWVLLSTGIDGVRAGPGDDQVSILAPRWPQPGTVLAGGRGHDLVHLGAFLGNPPLPLARVDLGAGRLVADSTRGTARWTVRIGLRGFEDARASARSLVVAGDSRANRLTWGGCEVHVRAGPGADLVRWARSRDVTTCPPGSHRIVIRGNRGPDRLLGSHYADLLDGGPGSDEARGGVGRDWCHAERTAQCEVSVP